VFKVATIGYPLAERRIGGFAFLFINDCTIADFSLPANLVVQPIPIVDFNVVKFEDAVTVPHPFFELPFKTESIRIINETVAVGEPFFAFPFVFELDFFVSDHKLVISIQILQHGIDQVIVLSFCSINALMCNFDAFLFLFIFAERDVHAIRDLRGVGSMLLRFNSARGVILIVFNLFRHDFVAVLAGDSNSG
jgi:hypothetical protein